MAQKFHLSIFDNKYKQSESQPDFKGSFVCKETFTFEKGKAYEVAGWQHDDKNMISIQSSEMSQEYAQKFIEKQNAKAQANESKQTQIYPDRKEQEPEVDYSKVDAYGRPIVEAPKTKIGEIEPLSDGVDDLPF